MAMHKIAVVLACLACTGHAEKFQSPSESHTLAMLLHSLNPAAAFTPGTLPFANKPIFTGSHRSVLQHRAPSARMVTEQEIEKEKADIMTTLGLEAAQVEDLSLHMMRQLSSTSPDKAPAGEASDPSAKIALEKIGEDEERIFQGLLAEREDELDAMSAAKKAEEVKKMETERDQMIAKRSKVYQEHRAKAAENENPWVPSADSAALKFWTGMMHHKHGNRLAAFQNFEAARKLLYSAPTDSKLDAAIAAVSKLKQQ